MGRKRDKKRYATITEESLRVNPSLFGSPLATFRRRAAALVIDLLIAFLLGIPTLFAITWISLSITHPRIVELLGELREAETSEKRGPIFSEFVSETTYLIYKRMPERMPADLLGAFERVDSTTIVNTRVDTTTSDTTLAYATFVDSAVVDSIAASYDWDYTVAFSDKPITRFNERDKTVNVGMYLFMGHMSMVVNFAGILIVYFTIFVWLLRGYTPGKWIFRIRIVRLDKKKLSLWDSFGRAGGYSASVATLGLGFFEALWHPNRQTVHDRISGTVVIRIKKPAKA